MNKIKSDFPIFDKYPDLVYLDNAATTQRPKSVVDRIGLFLAEENANIHRGVYDLSNKATSAYEEVRKKVAGFLNAPSTECIGFTSGTTDSANTIAQGYLKGQLKEGDNLIISIAEHHGNFIPWQQLAKEKKAELRIIPLTNNGDLELSQLPKLIDSKTKFVSVQHISNTLGTLHDIEHIIEISHQQNVPVMIDAAQSASLYSLDWDRIDYDFLAFSGHKVFGPFGVGVVFVAPNYQELVNPYKLGGGIIRDVQVDDTVFSGFPYVLDAGTPNISGVIGLGAALDYLVSLDRTELRKTQEELINTAADRLSGVQGLSVLGTPKRRSSIISFTVDGIHPHEIASFLNQDNIAVRAGMHCTQPLLDHLRTPATARMSTSIYNSVEDIDKLIDSLHGLIKFWS
ncbi:MAG: aminotransferase class V-fold PLP-dependent enzyme [Cyclobacteriaceae bacterium]